MNQQVGVYLDSEKETLRIKKNKTDKDKAKYIQFWNEFGQVLKEGLYEDLERKRYSTRIGKILK